MATSSPPTTPSSSTAALFSTVTISSQPRGNFISKLPGALSGFVEKIHLETGSALKARILSFHLPATNLEQSGLVEKLFKAPLRGIEQRGTFASSLLVALSIH